MSDLLILVVALIWVVLLLTLLITYFIKNKKKRFSGKLQPREFGFNILVVCNIIVWGLIGIKYIPTAFACKHENPKMNVVSEVNCVEDGVAEWVCLDCGKILMDCYEPKLGHDFGKYEVILLPSADADGVEQRTCSRCSVKENRALVCPHDFASSVVVVEPTCNREGWQNEICDDCGKIMSTSTIPIFEHREVYEVCRISATCTNEGIMDIFCVDCNSLVDSIYTKKAQCNFGDWVCSKYATPFDSGVRSRKCSVCGNQESKTYSMNMPSANSIYIPCASICNNIIVGEFFQSYVDKYDMVYAYAGNFGLGCNDPFVIGHNTKSLKNLHKTDVGQYIYLSVGGDIETYKVCISEYAVQNDSWTDIIGQSSGYSIFDNMECKTLHMYTCHGNDKNGRWMVLAKLVE